MRSEFEKLPEIAEELLIENQMRFDSSKNMYIHDNDDFQINLNFINGAWYAYQEQQKKINAAKEIIKHWHTWPCELKYGGNLMLDQLHKIEEELK